MAKKQKVKYMANTAKIAVVASLVASSVAGVDVTPAQASNDTTTPTLEVTSTTEGKTATVNVTATDDTEVASVMWLQGEKTVTDFATDGVDITTENKFDVTKNGIYTIYAKDSSGNESVKTITISDIDTEGYDESKVNLAHLRTTVVDGGIAIQLSDTGKSYGGEIHVPAMINGKKVVVIADMAFKLNHILGMSTAIYFEDSSAIKTIGASAFGTTTATNALDFPNVTSIGAGAFNSSKFKSITFGTGESVRTIGASAFTGTVATNKLTFPNLDAIAAGTFGNSQFSELDFGTGDTIDSIGVGAFASAVATNAVNFPSAKFLGTRAFQYSKFKSISFGDGQHLVDVGESALKSVVANNAIALPKVETIGRDGFAYSKFSAIDFGTGESVISIGIQAFTDATATNAIDFPNLTEIAYGSFDGAQFSSIGFGTGAQITSLSPYALADTKATNAVDFPNITKIPAQAFSKSNFTAISFGTGDNITVIEDSALVNTKAQNELTFKNITALPAQALLVTMFGKMTFDATKLISVDDRAIDFTLDDLKLTEQTDPAVKSRVTVDVSDRISIYEIKYAEGSKAKSYFETNGIDITESASFEATKNAVYTVYVRNSANQTKTAVITTAKVVADTTVPTLELTSTTEGKTATINVTATDDTEVASVKWLQGEKTVTDFATDGVDITTENRFEVVDNGIYTVYAKDSSGNASVKTIAITDLVEDTEAPTVELISEVNEGEATINVRASDNNGIAEVKWLAGNKTATDFTSAGTDVPNNDAFTVSQNGLYTVYVKDINGLVTLKTIDITSIVEYMPLAYFKTTTVAGGVTVGLNDTGLAYTGVVRVPAQLNGQPVIGLSNDAFSRSYYDNVTYNNITLSSKASKIVFEDASLIQTIGNDAFRSTSISEAIDFPNVTSIGKQAFMSTQFESITFGDGTALTTIGLNAFSRSNATNELNLPMLTAIPDGAFSASSFSELNFDGEKIETLGKTAFSNAKATNRLDFPKVKTLPSKVFQSTAFSSISFGTGAQIESISDSAFEESKATNALVLPSLKQNTIPKNAFNNSHFDSIDLGNTEQITQIAEGAFNGAKAQNAIDFPNVTSVGGDAFRSAQFSSISFGNGEQLTSIGKNAFSLTVATNALDFPNITNIADFTFDYSNFSAISFGTGENLKSIGSNAFLEAKALNTLELSNVETIGVDAFRQSRFAHIYINPSTYKGTNSIGSGYIKPTYTYDAVNGKVIVHTENVSKFNIVQVKFKYGSESVSFMRTSGTDITNTKEFSVNEGQTYTIYVKDIALNDVALTFTLPKDTFAPTVTVTDVVEEDVYKVVVNATDDSGIRAIRWAYGKYTDIYAVEGTNGEVITSKGFFEPQYTGTHTIFVTDNKGNTEVTHFYAVIPPIKSPILKLKELLTDESKTVNEKLQGIVQFVIAQDTAKGTQFEKDIGNLDTTGEEGLISDTINELSKEDTTAQIVLIEILDFVEQTLTPNENGGSTEGGSASVLSTLGELLKDTANNVTDKLQWIVDFVTSQDAEKGAQLTTDTTNLETSEIESLISDTISEVDKTDATETTVFTKILEFVSNLVTPTGDGNGSTEGGTNTGDGNGSTEGGTTGDGNGSTEGGTTGDGNGSTEGGTNTGDGNGSTEGGTNTGDGNGSTEGGTSTGDGNGSTEGGTSTGDGNGSTEGGTSTGDGNGSTEGGTNTGDGNGSTEGGTSTGDGNGSTEGGTGSETGEIPQEATSLSELGKLLKDAAKTVGDKLQGVIEFVTKQDAETGTQVATDVPNLDVSEQDALISTTLDAVEAEGATETTVVSKIVDFFKDLVTGDGNGSTEGGTNTGDGNGSTEGGTNTGDGNGSTEGGTNTGEGNGSTGGGTNTGDGNSSTGGGTNTGDGNGSTGGGTNTGEGNGSTGGGTNTGDGNGSTGGGTNTGDGNGSTGGGTSTGDGNGSTEGGSTTGDGNGSTEGGTNTGDGNGSTEGGSTTGDGNGSTEGGTNTGDGNGSTEGGSTTGDGNGSTEGGTNTGDGNGSTEGGSTTGDGNGSTEGGSTTGDGNGSTEGGTNTGDGNGSTEGGSTTGDGNGSTEGGSASALATLGELLKETANNVTDKLQGIIDFVTLQDAEKGAQLTTDMTNLETSEEEALITDTISEIDKTDATETSVFTKILDFVADLVNPTGDGSGSTEGGTNTGDGSGSTTGGGNGSTGGGSNTGDGQGSTAGGTSTGAGKNVVTEETLNDIFKDIANMTGDSGNQPLITMSEDAKDLTNKSVDTLVIRKDKIQATVGTETIDVATLDTDIKVEDLRVIRVKDGVETPVMQKHTGKELVITTPNGYEGLQLTESRNVNFEDVTTNNWFYDDVADLFNLSIVNGTTATTFAPNSELTRGQFAAMLARSLELTGKTAENYTLSDLDGKWYANDVQTLAGLGIVTGHLDGSFKGNATITRQQALSMVGRAIEHLGVEVEGTNGVTFEDAHKVHDYAKVYVEFLADREVIQSGAGVQLNPKNDITRAQISKVLLRALQLSKFY